MTRASARDLWSGRWTGADWAAGSGAAVVARADRATRGRGAV